VNSEKTLAVWQWKTLDSVGLRQALSFLQLQCLSYKTLYDCSSFTISPERPLADLARFRLRRRALFGSNRSRAD
jgi:hypothetical protein